VVPPCAVDEEVVPGDAFTLESQAREQGRAAPVFRNVVGHDAVHAPEREHEGVPCLQRFPHQSLAFAGPVDLAAKVAGLECAAKDLCIGEAADNARRISTQLHDETHGNVTVEVIDLLLQPSFPECRSENRRRERRAPPVKMPGFVLGKEGRHRLLHPGTRMAHNEALGLQLRQVVALHLRPAQEPGSGFQALKMRQAWGQPSIGERLKPLLANWCQRPITKSTSALA
jgi:hypothetical protein